MSTLEGAGLYTFLTIPPIAGLGDRVHPRRLPRDPVMPALVYRRVSTPPRLRSQSGPSGLAEPRFQLDIWAVDHDSADAIAELVRKRFDGYRGQMGDVVVGSARVVGEADLDEEDLGYARRVLDVEIQHEEAVA